MDKLQDVISTLDNAADSFDSIATKEQKKIYEEVITLAKELTTDGSGKVKQTIDNLKRLTQIKARLAALSKDKEWVAGIASFAKYFGILQQKQNAYFSSAFPEKTLSETAQKKNEMMKQIAVQNTMDALIGDGLKANVTDKLNDILLRAVTTGTKFADLQEELRAHLLGKDGGQGAFSRYATTYAVTALSQYTGQYNKLMTDDLDTQWFMYTGSNIETTREFCQLLTAKKYIHRSEIPEILKGNIDGQQCAIYPKTGLPYGMIEGTNEENFQCNCGGWNCRHQLVPVADAVVPASLRAKFAKPTDTPTDPAKAPETPPNAPIDLAPYQDQLNAIEQYIADHPKSAKLRGYYESVHKLAAEGNSDLLESVLSAAKADIAKFDAAKRAKENKSEEYNNWHNYNSSEFFIIKNEAKKTGVSIDELMDKTATFSQLDSSFNRVKQEVKQKRKEWQDACNDLQDLFNIAVQSNEMNVASDVIHEIEQYDWNNVTSNDMREKQIKRMQSFVEETQEELTKRKENAFYKKAVVPLKNTNIKNIPVNDMQQEINGKQVPHRLNETEIIERLAGGDRTNGSCASVALAYVGNKMGLDVLDFRGGKSESYFSADNNLREIVGNVGGVVKVPNKEGTKPQDLGWQLLGTMRKGHQYYFGCGKHVAIVRVQNGKFQYLELQDADSAANGWFELSQETLKSRFAPQGTWSYSCFIVDIDNFKTNPEFRTMLGYLNTGSGFQRKGKSGSKK